MDSNTNLSNINLNAEVIPLNEFGVKYSPEYNKGAPKTPNRPTRSIFGKLGQLPSNIPPTPHPIRRLTRWKEKKNKNCKSKKNYKETRRVNRK